MRRAALLGSGIVAALALGAPAQAADVPQHLAMSFDEDPVVTVVDGLGAGCPAFAGTLTEARHLEVSGWIRPDGDAHAVTTVTATVALVPADADGVGYDGTYVQHQAGAFTAAGEDDRVVTTTMHGVLSGSDGSTVRISEVVHWSVDRAGTLRASFDRFHCA